MTPKNYFSVLLLVLWSGLGFSQCVQQVDFNTWTKTGCYTGVFNIGNGGNSVNSTGDTPYPAMFVGPDTLINVRISGSFQVTGTDNDYVGFVFGYQSPDTIWGPNNTLPNADMEYYLFDWKKEDQTAFYGWFGLAQEGFSLVEVNGTYQYTQASSYPAFWNHTSSASFNVLQTDYSLTNGWVQNQVYDFELLYTPSRAVIKIDTDTIFDQTGCFPPGRFGFYNFSQWYAYYSNFDYELYVDFQMQAQYVCVGDSAKFSIFDTSNCSSANALSNIDTFYWDLGDGTLTNDTNPSHVYGTSDTFLVKLIAVDLNGCADTNTKEIYIQEPANALIGYSNACLGDSVSFTDQTVPAVGSIVGWNWDFGDGTAANLTQDPNHYYTNPGTYTVQLIAYTNAGCVDTTDTMVTVFDPPTVDFSFDNACDGDDNRFYDQSIPAGPAITQYFWDMNNDGTVEYTNDSAIHNFSGGFGTYYVELKVIDAAGCRDSIVDSVLVHPLPNPGFTGTSVCFGEENQFTDTSSVITGGISDLVWIFGDGDSAFSSSSVLHEFDSAGVRNIKLIVTSDSGCVDSTTGGVLVYALPTAEFATDSVCQDSSAVFINHSVAGYGTLVSYLWQFGDGSSSTNTSPFHPYANPGLYPVTHSVISDQGCKDTVSRNVRIYPVPTTAFSWTNNVCQGEEMLFQEQSFVEQITPGGDFIAEWEWIIDQTDTLYGSTPEIGNTDQYRTMTVSLTATTNYGCIATYENYPQIYPLPTASISEDIKCEDFASQFSNSSTVPNGIISGVSWDFGDGFSAEGNQVEHVYDYYGDYDVKLSIRTNRGCKDDVTKRIVVPGTPIVDFDLTPDFGCSPMMVQLTNKSTVNAGGLLYRWYIDGQEFSGEESPSLLVYTDSLEPQSFDIKLTAISEHNCQRSRTISDIVTVSPSPKAAFYLTTQDLNMFEPVAEFYNNSVQSIRWDWDFGDGNSSIDYSPSHMYEGSGDYDVTLISYNEYNCADTMMRRIEVEPKTTIYIPNSFTPNGDQQNETWIPKGFNEGYFYELTVWDRWGHLIFQTTSLGGGWDGTMPNNDLAPIGTYVYRINMETPEGEFREINGTFNLIR